ncbi:MAG: energy-coupling factor transporter ATPase [Dethiobacteria bacterium]|jgi:energy-coupling factor transport system ATP-binding protein|nr:energy-coupling factor transporter ATPase [Bacillota bacterium]NMD32472.1 energy-coupling factor transporter ATPase [Bacillota bacterium]HOB29469.1 energy-coupling factor transporter ATPase [Bacillota bacterium]HPZ42128.1 energy-coupling factor transporter ATPase [Bacillota bacterium]HQD51639.1 energy-coupling factor transporter ATPase [Bacillota bacterium]
MPIEVENLNHTYKEGTPFARQALFDINLKIDDGEFVGLIGPSQSGKSTLGQYFNALYIPKSGRVLIDGRDTADRNTDLVQIRFDVGYVFQNPEHQLFKTTVGEDIAFGPTCQRCSPEEIRKRVREAMALVGLDYDTFFKRDIFALSGGQKRRAAIAGVLACQPKVLILDGITAGLDPRGRKEILNVVKNLHQEGKMTVILISHSMDDVARLVERIIIMDQGRIIDDGPTREVLTKIGQLQQIGLEPPQVIEVMQRLRENGFTVTTGVLNIHEAISEIVKMLNMPGRE